MAKRAIAPAERSLAGRFWVELLEAVRDPALAPQLQAAGDGALLGPWTGLLTAAVVHACGGLEWTCAARSEGSRPLPVGRDEYLGIDVLAFGLGRGWRAPLAAFELENSARDKVVAYALWKACTVRASLSALFCYRRHQEQVGSMVTMLQQDVLMLLRPAAEVLVVVGTRSAAGTFPDGYFRPFTWDAELGRLRAGAGTGRSTSAREGA
jgi:hypothetical protein